MRTKEQRQERIVEILSLLHQGGSFEEAKRLFNEEFDGVDVTGDHLGRKSIDSKRFRPFGDPTSMQYSCGCI